MTDELEGAVERLTKFADLVEVSMPTSALCEVYEEMDCDLGVALAADLRLALAALQQQGEEGGPPVEDALAHVADATETDAQHSAGKWPADPSGYDTFHDLGLAPPRLDACEWPRGATFGFHDDPGEHDPCYVIMPGGAMLAFNHHVGEGVDIARARFVQNACNALLVAQRKAADQ